MNLDELLSPLVRDYGAMLAEKEITLSCEPARVRVTADRSRLTQVFTNLLDNASYFTTKGQISITVQKQGSEVAVAISDTGRGIDPEILPKLFTKFATKSEKGTGLGLYICKAKSRRTAAGFGPRTISPAAGPISTLRCLSSASGLSGNMQ